MHCCIYEIKKCMNIPFLIMSSICVAFVCCLSECYITADGKAFTIIEILLFTKADTLLTDVSLNRYEVWTRGIGYWTQILLPLLLSAGYLYVYSIEKQTKYNQFIIIRESKLLYCMSKMISIMVSGFVVMLMGYLLFFCIVYFKFPSISDFSEQEKESYLGLHQSFNEENLIISRFLKISLYGLCLNSFSYLISVFFVDRYILICLPIMLKYILTQLISKIEIDAINNNSEKILMCCSYFKMESLLNDDHDIKIIFYIIFPAIIYIMGFLFNFFMMKSKEGETGFE